MAFAASPTAAAVLTSTAVLGAALPIAFILLSGWAVGGITRRDTTSPALAIALLASVYLLQQVRYAIAPAVAQVVGVRVQQHLREQLLMSLGEQRTLAAIEEPAFRDKLNAALELTEPGQPLSRAYRPLANVVGFQGAGLAAAVTLGWLRPWLPIVVVVGAVVASSWLRSENEAIEAASSEVAPGLRRADYLQSLATDPGVAKEIRLFDAIPWLSACARVEWFAAMRVAWAMRRTDPRRFLVSLAVAGIAELAALLLVARAAIDGQIGAAGIAIFVQATFAAWTVGGNWTDRWEISLGVASLPQYDAVLTQLATKEGSPARSTRGAITLVSTAEPENSTDDAPSIMLRDVSFTYPTGQTALAGVSLDIAPRETLAIVGRNGAGKSTLVKILLGLYAPSSGHVTVVGGTSALGGRTGTDDEGNEDALERWRRTAGVMTLAFPRYPISLLENVALDETITGEVRATVSRVLSEIGFDEVARGLPSGMDTILSPGEPGGVDLSGGEWQRVALARTLFRLERGGRFAVLDEPVANLGIQEEIDFFEAFSSAANDATVIIVSHRIGTIRRADRIALLDQGRLVGLGSHAELLNSSGLYTALYEAQAHALRDESTL